MSKIPLPLRTREHVTLAAHGFGPVLGDMTSLPASPAQLMGKNGTMATALMLGEDEDDVTMPDGTVTTIRAIRDELKIMGLTAEKFSAMDDNKKDRLSNRVGKRIREKYPLSDPKVRARLHGMSRSVQVLHDYLTKNWANAPLEMEPVRASWLKYLQEFDREASSGSKDLLVELGVDSGRDRLIHSKDLQSIVVENDWGAAVPPALVGEWHTPFPECAWEFHLSGVRVVALTNEWDDGRIGMVCCYGMGGAWASDDYRYSDIRDLSRRLVPTAMPFHGRGVGIEFDRVALYAAKLIRSCCIMMDAEVAQFERVEGGAHREKHTGRVSRDSRPQRDHYVVRLIGHQHRRYQTARSAGMGTSGPRSLQRGHWRQGCWMHFDDPDSGREQYVNDGGFVVSKTWRRWHFAGDPNNIIHKEYRA